MIALVALLACGAQDVELIDRHLELLWKGEPGTPEAEDVDFLRRIALDLIGRIPSSAEVRSFLGDVGPDKRRRKIDELLASPEFAAFWSGRLADAWMGPLPLSDAAERGASFRAWLRRRVERPDARVGEIAREILTAPDGAFLARYLQGPTPRIDALAGELSYAFLGVRLRCAQCHDHPADRWTQEDFWGVAAFFARAESGPLEGQRGPLAPRYLDGTTPGAGDRRAALADRVVADPLFARAFVNRVWSWLLGGGLREPVERMTESGTSVAPDLLDALAADFARRDFELRPLLRAICASSAYRRSSKGAPDPLFRRFRLRPLTPEQHFASVSTATALPEAAAAMSDDLILSALGGRNATGEVKKFRIFRRWFLASPPDGIPRLLHALNRDFPLFAGTKAAGPGRLHDLLRSEPDDAIVEELFLSTLSRFPTEAERARARDHVARRGRDMAFEELFWALLNADEFVLQR